MNPFQPHETIETRQAIDYFENGFLRAVFRAMSGKSLPEGTPITKVAEERQKCLLAALSNLQQVAKQAVKNNPEDRQKITTNAHYYLGICFGRVAERFEQVEPSVVKAVESRCNELKNNFYLLKEL